MDTITITNAREIINTQKGGTLGTTIKIGMVVAFRNDDGNLLAWGKTLKAVKFLGEQIVGGCRYVKVIEG